MKKEELITALGQLGYQLFTTEKRKVGKKQIYDVLDELANSTDSRLIEAFPVVLANCANRGIKLDITTLLSRHGTRSQKRPRLEKLILASTDLLNQVGLEKPEGVDRVMKALRLKYGDLLVDENMALGKGLSVSTERLRNALRRYATDLERFESAREKEKERQLRSFQLNLHLSTLFPPEQKELVLKNSMENLSLRPSKSITHELSKRSLKLLPTARYGK